jgi:hypothetical protein
MLPKLIDQLFGMLWDLAKFVWKLSVVTIVIIGIPTLMLGVLDWLLSFGASGSRRKNLHYDKRLICIGCKRAVCLYRDGRRGHTFLKPTGVPP